MQSDSATVPPPAPSPASDSARSLWQLGRAFVLRYRIRISLVVFVLLIAEDVWEGLRPHNLFNYTDPKSVAGLALIAAGLAIRSWAAGILHKTAQLTTSGPYSLVRHRLYTGSFLMMIGFCLLIDDAENIWFVLGPFVVIYVIKLLHEERVLSTKFGTLWQQYAQSVPRFFPTRLRTAGAANWSGTQWLGNREYNALAATAVGLIAIQAWALL